MYCQAIARNPELSAIELMENYLYGPDFPTAGIILGRSGIKQAYETGMGTVTVRGKIKIVNLPNNKKESKICKIYKKILDFIIKKQRK